MHVFGVVRFQTQAKTLAFWFLVVQVGVSWISWTAFEGHFIVLLREANNPINYPGDANGLGHSVIISNGIRLDLMTRKCLSRQVVIVKPRC